MLGTLRLGLAIFVVIFHMGVGAYGALHLGVAAVVCFYIISGYVMSGLVAKEFSHTRRDTIRFFKDRLLRLAPQYYFWLTAATVGIVLGYRHPLFQSGEQNILSVVGNLTVLPLGFATFIPALENALVIPQAWSLSVELLLYLSLPLIVRSRRTAWCILWLSTMGLGAAMAGVIAAPYFSYFMLPGPMVFFLMGHVLYRRDVKMGTALFAMLAADFVVALVSGRFFAPNTYNIDLFVGGVCGFAIVAVATHLKRRGWDDALGNMSYGCYLSHFIFVTLFIHHHGDWLYTLLAIALSVAGGWVGYAAVEAPVNKFRRDVRRKARVRSAPVLAANMSVTG
ncbi:acyltransferase [Parvibaculum sp.]|uniref:acyltransferase family protein n=1 Tax=Parvibaculum sp. TaxID=2024848 RepID=UPI002BC0A634|nr:acyltransferase [Parvibaculum sp.]HUD49986.1 acyltransferase [Parvibaculum sp.]